MFYVYMTENILNGKKYIGQHNVNPLKDNYRGSGKLISRAIKKYGIENFSCKILGEYESREECSVMEAHFIIKYDAIESKDFYNLAPGGFGGARKWSPETRLKHEEINRKRKESGIPKKFRRN
ncbi:homing endonuclease [Agrobacterium phage OLIVR5]|uniref:Homing endonuclease n=1 Tax=Agrobacterium phage OLIVR5 TaxID=2723773 RepID=A0A858MT48_9CAUD|nr:homing endonuclease [Agrobacterium phage OLIVR5]QIW87886.1 homing endonuclease [Agrobacterium phage OLIVR5]QIW88151.1 homing endonuclease [Agrobacterium phage OLIVR6]